MKYKNYIEGRWVESDSRRTYEVKNPAHKATVIGEFQASTPRDAKWAVDAASYALTGWANTPAPVRAAILFRAAGVMERRSDELAKSIVREEGKTISDAKAEVRRAINATEYSAGEGRRMFGYTTPSESPNMVAYTMRRPLGVVAVITPWNFPLAIPAWKIAPALVCGNTVVFKPASSTPLTAVKMMECYVDAGIPAGVLNLITGSGSSVGNVLVESPDVKAISFTGSIEIGSRIYTDGARALKKVQCELGGKNGVIVMADADMERAIEDIVIGAFGSTGQLCTATSRVIVEESVHDEFVSRLIARTGRIRVGDGIDTNIDMGTLSSASQFDTVLKYIGAGAEEGAKLAFGGKALSGVPYDEGYYVQPTIFTDVKPEMRIAQEEIFGPVLTVFKAKDVEQAISICNNVRFGLSSSIYTNDLTQAFQYVNTVETGMVHVNAPTLGGEVHLPFGGMKASSVGHREQGTAAVEFFTETVTVYINHAAKKI